MLEPERSEAVITHRFELNGAAAWTVGTVGFIGVLSCAAVGEVAFKNLPQIIQQLSVLLGK